MNKPGRLAYSIKETCELVSLGKTRVYELINSDDLKVVRIGRRTLVLADSIGDLLARDDEPNRE